MYEVELTAIVKDRERMLKQLERFSGDSGQPVSYEDEYYDKSKTLKTEDKELRLRRKTFQNTNEQSSWLTLKTATFDQKTRSKPEYETQVIDYKATKAIFEKLGYRLDIAYRKECIFYFITYQERELEVSLVDLPELTNTHIEIELQVENKDQTDEAFEVVYSFLNEIGLTENDFSHVPYQDAVREARKKSKTKIE